MWSVPKLGALISFLGYKLQKFFCKGDFFIAPILIKAVWGPYKNLKGDNLYTIYFESPLVVAYCIIVNIT